MPYAWLFSTIGGLAVVCWALGPSTFGSLVFFFFLCWMAGEKGGEKWWSFNSLFLPALAVLAGICWFFPSTSNRGWWLLHIVAACLSSVIIYFSYRQTAKDMNEALAEIHAPKSEYW